MAHPGIAMQIYPDMVEDPDTQTQTVLYGAKTGYFRKDLIVFYNFNPLRYVTHLHFIQLHSVCCNN